LRDLPLPHHVRDVAQPLLLGIARALRLLAARGDHLAARSPASFFGLGSPRLPGFLGSLAVDDEHLADSLHRMRGEPLANRSEPGLAHVAVTARGAHLDELVRLEGPVDLGDHLVGEAFVADDDDGAELVGFGAQLAAALCGECDHRGSIGK